jgi:hypothetical protein
MSRGTKGWKGCGGRHGEAQLPLLAACRALCRLDAGLDPQQGSAGVDQQAAAGLGQRHAARQSAEELHAQVPLQRASLVAERRLLDAQPLGRAGDMPFLGDGDEVAEVTELHAICRVYGFRGWAIVAGLRPGC